jgi:hypothetical protein
MIRAAVAALRREIDDQVEERAAAARREARRMATWCHNTRQPAASWFELDALQRKEFERVAQEHEAKVAAKTKTPKRR